ncbi:MAG: hypothetical protein EHM54_07730 [Nitrospiraceae bacterium]|jgi:hypothetical protein|nr:MAG: hypothetical protein EHM54_07730 [Nitrospiraceae bacterium]
MKFKRFYAEQMLGGANIMGVTEQGEKVVIARSMQQHIDHVLQALRLYALLSDYTLTEDGSSRFRVEVRTA